MARHFPEEFSIRLIGWSLFAVMSNTMPPRDPNENGEDADEEDEEDDEEDLVESPVVREPED